MLIILRFGISLYVDSVVWKCYRMIRLLCRRESLGGLDVLKIKPLVGMDMPAHSSFLVSHRWRTRPELVFRYPYQPRTIGGEAKLAGEKIRWMKLVLLHLISLLLFIVLERFLFSSLLWEALPLKVASCLLLESCHNSYSSAKQSLLNRKNRVRFSISKSEYHILA